MRSNQRLQVLEHLRAGEDVLIIAPTPRQAAREALTIRKLAHSLGIQLRGHARVPSEMPSWWMADELRPRWLDREGFVVKPPEDPDVPPYEGHLRWT